VESTFSEKEDRYRFERKKGKHSTLTADGKAAKKIAREGVQAVTFIWGRRG